jgi:hypothetical protein
MLVKEKKTQSFLRFFRYLTKEGKNLKKGGSKRGEQVRKDKSNSEERRRKVLRKEDKTCKWFRGKHLRR